VVQRKSRSRLARRNSSKSPTSRAKPSVTTRPSFVNGGGEVVLYEAPDGRVQLDVRLDRDTVWLTQAQMAELFGRERSVITKHIRGVFRKGNWRLSQYVQILHVLPRTISWRTGRRAKTSFTESIVEDTALVAGEPRLRGQQLLPKKQQLNSKAIVEKMNIAVSKKATVSKLEIGWCLRSRDKFRKRCGNYRG
jgi:murein DD-endopeptidase MepM/ murein hydrolase activator NlpD